MKSVNPATTIRERIQGFSFILTHPNERDAYNFSAVSLYRKSKREYFIKASMVFREREKKPHPETNFFEK
jgi:ubiquitin-protein ligase